MSEKQYTPAEALQQIINNCMNINDARCGLDNAIARIQQIAEKALRPSESPKGHAVWVKGSKRYPEGHSADYHWRFAHSRKPIVRVFHIALGSLIMEYNNTRARYSLDEVEWLDESNETTPTVRQKEDAVLPDDDAVQNWFEENIDKECSASSAIYKFRLWLESLQNKNAAAGSGKEEAVAFAEWIKNEQWNQRSGLDWARYETRFSDVSIKTTSELYDLYKQSK